MTERIRLRINNAADMQLEDIIEAVAAYELKANEAAKLGDLSAFEQAVRQVRVLLEHGDDALRMVYTARAIELAELDAGEGT